LEGIGVAVDYQEAFRLLSGAADRGASRAVANLARKPKDWEFPKISLRQFVF